jgi:hypothetical protein
MFFLPLHGRDADGDGEESGWDGRKNLQLIGVNTPWLQGRVRRIVWSSAAVSACGMMDSNETKFLFSDCAQGLFVTSTVPLLVGNGGCGPFHHVA